MNDIKWKRNVALFMTGQGLSLFGSMLVHYAVMWHITLKTQSGAMMTLIAVAGALPMFFISPFGGVWADRYNKKHLINIADAAIAMFTLVLAVIFSLGIDLTGLLLVCLVMRALGQGVQSPAVNAFIPEIVPQELLTRVNGISGSVQSVVMFASPMAGGALLSVAPIHMLMYIDVITAIIGISILLFFVKAPVQSQEKHSGVPSAIDVGIENENAGSNTNAKKYFIEISEGLEYIKYHTFVKKLMVLNALFNIVIAPTAVLTPLQVARNWGDDIWILPMSRSFGAEQRLASMEAVFFCGMILGGLVIGAWGGFKNKSHSMALFILLHSIGIIGLGLLNNFWIYIAFIGLNGIFMSMFNAPLMATLQTNVEAAYMGRVFSVLGMIGSLMMPLGMVLWGPLSDVVSIDWLLIGTGASLFLMSFVFLFDKTLLKAGAPMRSDPKL
ncbi:MAG: MFS transporter [Oscillospiraceae bacterium]|nr:MFS transporter [Oscillospiraceae bacterium]